MYRRNEGGENAVERPLYGCGVATDPLRRCTPLLHRLYDPANLTLRLAHTGAHLLRGSRALLGELPNLARDDAEPQPMLSGARGFDGRVERQQIGLTRNARDPVHELADFPRFTIELDRDLCRVIHVHEQIHQVRARPRYLFAAAMRLQGDLGDSPLRFLGARVQRGRETRRCFRVLAAGDDELALALRSFR